MRRVRTVVALAVLVAACSGSGVETESTTTTVAGPAGTAASATSDRSVETTTAPTDGFPVTVTASNGDVTIDRRPEAIVSLSPTATEMLFAVGAGDQVIAVDEYSYYPEDAPVTDLSGFTPNIEAIMSFEPDLVVVSDDIDGVIGSLDDLGVTAIQLSGFDVVELDGIYRQMEILGSATGHGSEGTAATSDLRSRVLEVLSATDGLGTGLTYYHELDPTFYTVTSSTFLGHVYGLFGLENIADAADPDGESFGYPQLTQEYILEANPDLIFVTDCCGDSADTIAARPGWSGLSAVVSNSIVVVDDDVASRWGPRIVDMMETIAAALSDRSES